MAWADYGFDGFDMALKPIDLTLRGMFLALKERMDAASVSNSHYNNFSNGHYMFWPDADGSRTANQASRYNGVESIINSLFNGYFVNSKLSNYFNIDYTSDNKDAMLDKACDFLNDNGFLTTKIPFNENWKLMPYNKHWLIQRKVLINMLRYWLVQLTESWTSGSGDKILVEYQDTPRDGFDPIYQDTLADVFTNLSQSKMRISPWSSSNVLPLFYVNKVYRYDVSKYGYYCQAILNNLYINKTFVDDAITAHNDSDLRLKIQSDQYDNVNVFDGKFLLQNFLLNNTYTFPNYGTFYKINFPYSTDDLIDIILDNESYLDNNSYMFEQMRANSYLYQVGDGADSFQFLDT